MSASGEEKPRKGQCQDRDNYQAPYCESTRGSRATSNTALNYNSRTANAITSSYNQSTARSHTTSSPATTTNPRPSDLRRMATTNNLSLAHRSHGPKHPYICNDTKSTIPSLSVVEALTPKPFSVASQASAIQTLALATEQPPSPSTSTSTSPNHPTTANAILITLTTQNNTRLLTTQSGAIQTFHRDANDLKQATRMANASDAGLLPSIISSARGSVIPNSGLGADETDALRTWIRHTKEKLGHLCPGAARFYRAKPIPTAAAAGGSRGWECGGKNHFLPDSSLATGIPMMYVSTAVLQMEGISANARPDLWAKPPPGEGIPDRYRGPVTEGVSVDEEAGRIVWDTGRVASGGRDVKRDGRDGVGGLGHVHGL